MEKHELAVLSLIAGAILGFVGTYFNTRIAFKRQLQNVAASEFKEAFVEEMAWCLSKDEFRIKEKVSSSFIKQQKAIIVYETFLCKTEIERLRRVWGKYCQGMEFQILNDFVPEPGINHEGCIRELSEQEQRKLMLAHYRSIISFAK